MARRKVLFALGSRANWGSCKAVVRAAVQREGLEVYCVAYGTAVLERYGSVACEIARSVETLTAHTHVEGGTPADAVASSALALTELSRVYQRVQPDLVYVVGDRLEVLPAAYAAHLLGIRIAHQMGGELSGTRDEPTRHAISKLAHWHFAATMRAAERLRRMGEGAVWHPGCPRLDLCVPSSEPSSEHVMVIWHPEGRWPGAELHAVLAAVERAWQGETHVWWPNSDPGCEQIVQAIRDRRGKYQTHRNLAPEEFLAMLARTRVIVGNSSAAIREGSYLGTRAVNVGARQQYRERAGNVADVSVDTSAIERAIRLQLGEQCAPSSTLYGDGRATERIMRTLSEQELPAQQKVWNE